MLYMYVYVHYAHTHVTVLISLQVRGKDNVGATMDSMDLERQRGITIQVLAYDHQLYFSHSGNYLIY